MSSFFSKYPKINYDLYSDGSEFELTDISRAVIINSNRIADDSALYTYYSINDGDRPDVVSHKIYGTTQYYWTFFVVNDDLRDGYSSSWPLSYLNFMKMIEREYSRYSALSITPITDPEHELNGTGLLDISFIPLTSQYLPYLKFVSADGIYRSNLIRYDHRRHQCIIGDIHKIINSSRVEVASREDFVESTNHAYKIIWDDSAIESGLTPSEAQDKNATLKAQWVEEIYKLIEPYDPVGVEERITARVSHADYIASKRIHVAPPEFRWSDYANTAYEYYSTDDTIMTAYDVLTSNRIVFPKIKSFYEYESEQNDSKRMIRVIRPEFIEEFSERYFDTINDVL